MKQLVTPLFAFCLVSACGGGGGGSTSLNNPTGGGGSSGGGDTFSYTKLENLTTGSSIDLSSRVLVYRATENNSVSVLSGALFGAESSIALVENSNGNIGNNFSINKKFSDSNGQAYNPNFEVNWSIDVFEEPSSIGNALDEFVYWWLQDGTFNDTTTISQTSYTALGFGYWIDQASLAGYLKTEYVVPLLVSMDFGGNCVIGGSCDDDYSEDILAAVGGDYTEVSDMPTSGTAYMDGKGLALFHVDDIGFDTGSVGHFLAAESDGDIDIDHAAGTVTGYLTFDAVFRKQPYSFSWPRLEGWDAGTVQIDGTIDGRTASGTVTWGGANYGSGFFNGAFFGPDGKEFGGVITATDDLDSDWSQLILAFVAKES